MWDFDFRPRCAAGDDLISALNLRGLKSQDNKTWHLGSLSDLELHGPNGILICGRVAPQTTIYDFLFIISKKPNMSSAALVGYRKTVRAVSITISLNAPSLTFCLKSYAVEAGLAGQDIFILRVNFRAATETTAQTLNL